uniref:Uncharacterized protein n=1 Tax=Anas zonorhyncha TaxID=75864 RepID=A0A8B9V058_9AVES
MSPPCPLVPTIPSPFPPLPHALPTPKMAAAASAERQEPALSPPGRRSAGFLAKMAAPSGRSGRGLWGAVVAAAALLWLGARAAEGPSTAEFDVRPGGEVHSFSRSLGGYTCTFTYSAQGGTNEVSQASLQMVPLPLGPVAAQNKKKNIQDICVDTGGDWEGCGCRDKRLLFCPKPRLVSHRPVPLV